MQVIAEIGVNHDGSLDTARRLVDACAELKADHAKFQIFRTDRLTTDSAARAAYQADELGADSQADMLRRLELTEDEFHAVARHCEGAGIGFLATPFDEASARFLTRDLGCDTVKVGSGDLDNVPLLIAIAAEGVRLIVSTGMATLGEIELAVNAVAYGAGLAQRGEAWDGATLPTPEEMATARAELGFDLGERLTLLHCTSEYPAAHGTLNMRAIGLLRHAFGLPVGFSDHSEDHVAAILAVGEGASVIERHITYDRSAAGPDHRASLDPAAFGEMMRVLSAAEAALGTGRKSMSVGERGVRAVARKRIVAAVPVAAGETLTLKNVALKRAAVGLPASRLFEVIGRPAARDLAPDEPVAS